MSSTSTLGIARDLVQPVAPLPAPRVEPRDEIPELEPVPDTAARSLVTVGPPPTPPWWKLWSTGPRAPRPADEPYWVDASRAATQLASLRSQLDYIHGNLANDVWVMSHRQPAELFKAAEALRTSVVASLSGLKHRLDAGAAAGVGAALSGHSRAEFARIATELRAMDVERRPLEKTATERHAELRAAEEKLAKERAAAETITRGKTAELQALTPDDRSRLMTRIAQVRALGFAFARYAHTSPEWRNDADHEALATNMVIPHLTLRGSIDFNALWPNTNYLKFEGWKRITSLAELEDVLDSMLGRDPDRRSE